MTDLGEQHRLLGLAINRENWNGRRCHSVVLHFSISGRQVRNWGPIPATNRPVRYDEIVIMQIRDMKVYRQVGVADNLLGLQQIGAIADPAGFGRRSLSEGE